MLQSNCGTDGFPLCLEKHTGETSVGLKRTVRSLKICHVPYQIAFEKNGDEHCTVSRVLSISVYKHVLSGSQALSYCYVLSADLRGTFATFV